MSMGSVHIISIEDARRTLRLDDEENDLILEDMLDSIDSYIFEATGRRWQEDIVVEPGAKAAARMKLRIDYFGLTDQLMSQRLTAQIKQLQTRAAIIGV